VHPYFAPDFEVKISGLTMAADVRNAVIDLSCESSLDQAGMFKLTLDNRDLRLTDSPLLNVGKTVEIHMGYANDLQPKMLGEIVAVQPSFPSSGAPTIVITGYDKSHRMRNNKPARFTYKMMNDTAIAAIIAAENLLIPVVDPSPFPARESVQQLGSDWALLTELAERNYFQLYVWWDRLYFRFQRPQTEKVVLEWGKNLSSFSPRLSTSGQFGIQEIRGWNAELAEQIVAILPSVSLGTDIDDIVERLGSGIVDQLVTMGRNVVRSQPVETQFDALMLAKSLLLQLIQGLYEATGSCIGIPMMKAGDVVEIRGIGKRFSGNYTLTRVTHSISKSGYRTDFEMSQRHSGSLAQLLRSKISGESASLDRSSKSQPMGGMTIGKVVNNLDTKGLGRVQLSFPYLSDVNLSAWARVASPWAGSSNGIYFLPDIDDECLVTFEQGDINKPIVIGSLWNGKNRPLDVNAGLNEKKIIKTKTGMQVTFDETKGNESLALTDGKGSSVTLNAVTGVLAIKAKGNVKIEDGAGSSIVLDANTKKITIEAKGDVEIKSAASGKIKLNP